MKERKEKKGLKKLRSYQGDNKRGPRHHCSNCGCDRYSPCGCSKASGK